MKKRMVLRLVSLIMFISAVVFVGCALSNPQMGRTIYIGSFPFGAEAWRVCYGIYTAAMATLFGSSFLVKE